MQAFEICERLAKEGVPQKTIEKFIDYIAHNYDVWREFERFALQAIAANRKIGAKAIMERVRWEVEIEKSGEYRANNNYTAYLSRVFELKHPHHQGYFEMREVKGLGEKND